MDWLVELPTIILLVMCLVCSASFSGSETALFSIDEEKQKRLRSGSALERAVAALLAQPQALLVTILLCNLVVNVLYFSASATLAGRLEHPGIATAANVGCFLLLLVFGEVVPKSIAINMPLRIAKLAVYPLRLLVLAMRPLRWVLESLTEALSQPLFRRLKNAEMTAEDLHQLVEMIAQGGELSVSENTFMRRVLELRHVKVRELMVPRVDLPFFDITAGRKAYLELLARTRQRATVAYRGDPEDVVGVILAKNVLFGELEPVEAVSRVRFVPELKRVDQLLRQFRDEKIARALVVDEYGTVAGLITIENLLEWVVGNIANEFETVTPPVRTDDAGRWILRGDLPVRLWRELMGTELDIPQDVDTLGGLIAHLSGTIPEAGDKVRHGKLCFTVRSVKKGRILEAALDPVKEDE